MWTIFSSYWSLLGSSVQSLHVSSSLWPHELQHTKASLSITNSQSPAKAMSIESMTPSNHLILRRPLLLLPSICPSFKVFSNESALHIGWPKYWSFQLRHQPFQWTPRTYFLKDGLVGSPQSEGLSRVFSNTTVQKHQLLKIKHLCSAFFIVQLLHPYMTTGKTIVLTRSTFVEKVMSLHFNVLSRLVITFLPRIIF